MLHTIQPRVQTDDDLYHNKDQCVKLTLLALSLGIEKLYVAIRGVYVFLDGLFVY